MLRTNLKMLVIDQSDVSTVLICVLRLRLCEFKSNGFLFQKQTNKQTHCPFQEFVVSVSGAFFPFHKL